MGFEIRQDPASIAEGHWKKMTACAGIIPAVYLIWAARSMFYSIHGFTFFGFIVTTVAAGAFGLVAFIYFTLYKKALDSQGGEYKFIRIVDNIIETGKVINDEHWVKKKHDISNITKAELLEDGNCLIKTGALKGFRLNVISYHAGDVDNMITLLQQRMKGGKTA